MVRESHPVDHHLGARVRLARAERGISQTALGESIGVTFQQIQKSERGTNRISASKLLRIAKALEKDISFFFNDVEEGVIAREHLDTPPIVPTRYDLKLMTLLSKIEDNNLKRRLYLLMEAIVMNKVEGAAAAEKSPALD
jgi:transcriptional regulator with XRE-family HTH domain